MKITYLELQNLKKNLSVWMTEQTQVFQCLEFAIFVSYGKSNQRCQVWSSKDNQPQTLINRTHTFLEKIITNQNLEEIEYLKFDLAIDIQKQNWEEVVKAVHTQSHNNHYRKGISFDERFDVCFLEQEIYGRAIIRGLTYDKPNFFDEKNLNTAIKKKYPKLNQQFNIQNIQHVWTFDSIACLYENSQLIPLQSKGVVNGIRSIQQNKKNYLKNLVIQNAKFLHDQIGENGRYVYGYFPAYDREISGYNTVRHCTSTYALIETFEINEQVEYWAKVHAAIRYALDHLYREVTDNTAYMIDGKEEQHEIKLGANAAAILMLTKYQEITGDNQYLKYAEKIAKGIYSMIDTQGGTTHVLHYPSLEVKEKFRIVYYDGESALALLRLYQINHDPQLLETVKLMFDNFIANHYEKYHDHWLSYCTNELTKICPEEKYFQFGLSNYLKHMEFIRQRKTVYATFLEMMMSAYKMVLRLKAEGYDALFEQAQFDKLKELIELRSEFQLTGFMYPEVAMYMARPDKILHSFYVRHDRFRIRIDDQEHNLSGYVAYIQHFDPE